MGEFADTNYNNAITRDNLLSMLYPRLVLAKQLLSDEGVIFCSIDDKNHAYVKGVFDEIFGDRNYIGEYVRQSKVGGGNDSKFIVKEHEYCIVYTKDKSSAEPMGIDHNEKYLKRYKEEDENGRYFWDTLARPGLKNPIYYDIPLPDGTSINRGWICSEKTFYEKLNNGQIRIKENDRDSDGKYSIQFKQYLNSKKIPRSFSTDFGGNTDGTSDLEKIFGDKIFSYPKPVKFIKTILSTLSKDYLIVLDFFAGSGTTGQAVLELNKEDGGNRTFILCTNNEITKSTPNGIAYDVTSKRLKRVMSGSCYDGTNDFEWIKKNSPLGDNLDVYEIAEVSNSEQTEGKSPFDVIDEELYGEVKMTPKDKIKWVCENFSVTQKYLEDLN